MYKTVKEVHIAIQQRLQQIASDRNQSIADQFIDMCLNKALYQVIRTKFDNRSNAKQQGFEDSVLRYDELQSLKRNVLLYHDIDNNTDVIKSYRLPSDYLYTISATADVNLLYTKVSNVSTTSSYKPFLFKNCQSLSSLSDALTCSISVNGKVYTFQSTIAPQVLSREDMFFIVKNEFDNFLKIVSTSTGILFYQIDNYISHKMDSEYAYTSSSAVTISGNIITVGTPKVRNIDKYTPIVGSVDNIRCPVRLLSTLDRDIISNNYYFSKSSLKSPIAVILNDRIDITTHYIATNQYINIYNVYFEYISKPVEFSIDTGVMPNNIGFIDDIINIAIADLLLILKDPTFTQSIQQTNQQI